MEIKVLDLEVCFNSLVIPRPYGMHVFEQIVFKCPICATEVFFTESSFEKHSQSTFSNLDTFDKKSVDNYIAENKLAVNHF